MTNSRAVRRCQSRPASRRRPPRCVRRVSTPRTGARSTTRAPRLRRSRRVMRRVLRAGGTDRLARPVADAGRPAVVGFGVAGVAHRVHVDAEALAGRSEDRVGVRRPEGGKGVGLLPRRRVGVVGRAGDAQLALRGGVVRPEVAVADGPCRTPVSGVESKSRAVEPHHHPLPVERRPADALHAGGVQRVKRLAGRGTRRGPPISHGPPRPGRMCCSSCSRFAVEPRPGFEDDDRRPRLGESVSHDTAGGPGTDDAHVGARTGDRSISAGVRGPRLSRGSQEPRRVATARFACRHAVLQKWARRD